MSRYHAIVMGDIVRSGAAAHPEQLARGFKKLVQAANVAFKSSILSPLTITLGDEFQGVTVSLTDAARLVQAFSLQCRQVHIDCRFVIGLGEISTPINHKQAWGMLGPGLKASRDRLLERDPNRHRFVLPEPVVQTTLNALGLAWTDIETNWTDRQFEVVYESLQSGSRPDDVVAKSFKFTKTALYKHRKAARYSLYLELNRAIENALQDLDRRYKTQST